VALTKQTDKQHTVKQFCNFIPELINYQQHGTTFLNKYQ